MSLKTALNRELSGGGVNRPGQVAGGEFNLHTAHPGTGDNSFTVTFSGKTGITTFTNSITVKIPLFTP